MRTRQEFRLIDAKVRIIRCAPTSINLRVPVKIGEAARDIIPSQPVLTFR